MIRWNTSDGGRVDVHGYVCACVRCLRCYVNWCMGLAMQCFIQHTSSHGDRRSEGSDYDSG